MKARVKATGVVIDVKECDTVHKGMGYDYISINNNYVYKHSDLEVDIEPDYWEKLKHQYAGMVMQGVLSDKEMFNTITEGVWPPNRPAYIAARCDEYATALVNRLKEESQCEK